MNGSRLFQREGSRREGRETGRLRGETDLCDKGELRLFIAWRPRGGAAAVRSPVEDQLFILL